MAEEQDGVITFSSTNSLKEQQNGEHVLPDVRIPEREERRLPRQCNSQEGKFITNSSQGFLPQPTQWCMVRKALSRGCQPNL